MAQDKTTFFAKFNCRNYNYKYFHVLIGLWEVCLNGFHDMRHQYEFLFYGCRHILLEEYDIIRDEIQPRKFFDFHFLKLLSILVLQNLISTYFYSFPALLLSMILIVMYLLCVDEYYRVSVLKWTGIGLIFSGKKIHEKERRMMILKF